MTPGLATAAVAASLLLAQPAAAGAAADDGPGATDVPAATGEDPWLTLLDDGYVRLTIPNAAVEDAIGPVERLVVEGSFGPSGSWVEYGTGLEDGTWSTTFGPMEPGLYWYQLTGDNSKDFKDPTNPSSVAAQPTWSTFFIPGESVALLADAPEEAGAIETLTYHSDVADEQRTAFVWTPPEYRERGKPYPVLYLQHGEDHGPGSWTEVGRAGQILDNLALSGELADMVVVMGDGDVADFTTELVENLVPAVRESFNVSRAKKDQALAGIGSGGSQVFDVLAAHPREFSYLGTFGSGTFDLSEVPVRQLNNHTRLLRLYVGNKTDAAYNDVYEAMAQFDARGLQYQFDGVNPDAGHNWNAWQENLIDFAPRLFHGQQTGDPGFSQGHTALEEPFDPPAPGATPTPWITDDGFVTFETSDELAHAEEVRVWANWGPGGSWPEVEMTLVSDRWRVTVGPLEPWSYYYQFKVDESAYKDTSNPTTVTSEPTWSTFFVEGEESRLLADVPPAEAGSLDVLSYHSDVAGEDRQAYVWSPPHYDPDRPEAYPLLVLNHGGGQSWTDWVEVGRARQILDNLSRDGALEPMVVVMPNGNVDDYPTEVLDHVVPAVGQSYHISDDPDRRAMVGLSLGGMRTMSLALTNPGEFSSFGVFAGFLFGVPAGVDAEKVNAQTDLIRLYTGGITDFTNPMVYELMDTLDGLGVEYEFDGVTEGPHCWDVWQRNLIDFLPRLFQDAT